MKPDNTHILCIAGLTGITILQVILRYVFNSPLMWAEELCRYLMIWGVMLGATVLMDGSRHMRIDFFIELLHANARKIVLVIIEILVFALAVLLSVQGIQYAGELSKVVTPALKIPKSFVVVSIPVCTLTWCLFTVNNIVDLIGKKENDKEADKISL
jgi:TRAP-type C4-dicarboxylate transport system permease small subunit